MNSSLPPPHPNQVRILWWTVTALAMAAQLVHCDRVVAAEELELLREMSSLMTLPTGRAEQILDVIAVLNRDSLAA